ncbi:MAG: cytochrome c family protein [Nitriliruptorales bacterium]
MVGSARLTRGRKGLRLLTGWGLVGAAAFAVAACGGQPRTGAALEAPASADLGREAISYYGCGACHTISGVPNADGGAAPPIDHFSRRAYIAGRLANTPENLARWIEDPQAVEPGTAMPNLGVTPDDARNIAAYLHSMR